MRHCYIFHSSCIIRGNAFYFAVLIPVCMVLAINLGIFIPVFRKIFAGGDKLLKDSIQEKQMINAKRAKTSFAVITVLGLSWLFGVLAIGDLRDTFQWIFCILSSLQGFFIFVLYVLTNVEAQTAWKSTCGCSVKRKTNTYSTNMRLLNAAANRKGMSITSMWLM